MLYFFYHNGILIIVLKKHKASFKSFKGDCFESNLDNWPFSF